MPHRSPPHRGFSFLKEIFICENDTPTTLLQNAPVHQKSLPKHYNFIIYSDSTNKILSIEYKISDIIIKFYLKNR